jgi:hypothetical protein
METHAHHLHTAPGKKWTHYFFEFLMLFLAVFLGFIAENQREHNVEKDRAHQFLQSMLLDVSILIQAIILIFSKWKNWLIIMMC